MQHKLVKNAVDPSATLPELTLRACLLSTLLTILFTASNIYLGLKVGLTFATGIPAAIVAMTILGRCKGSNILENTAVQTFSSTAGTISSMVFVLPAMIMVGYWTAFPYWETMSICLIGGLLGILFSIPLRRALVVQGDLPYPEGVAAAEILNVGHASHQALSKNEPGIKDILLGSVVGGLFTLFSRGFHIMAETLGYYVKVGHSVFSFASDCSFALVGAGYIIGIRVGIAMLIGTIISWYIAVPWFSAHSDLVGNAHDIANTIWATKVRFIGVGTIAVAAIWTIFLLLKPISVGIKSSFHAIAKIRLSGKDSILRTERDIPITLVGSGILILMIPLFALLSYFICGQQMPISSNMVIMLIIFSVVFILFLSFIAAAIGGYMAGLVGSSNSPISSVNILITITIACFLVVFLHPEPHSHFGELIIALTIYITGVVLAVGVISNNNLQDLKTGQLVGATPWKQQLSLIYGIVIGALVVPIVIQLLYMAYGFVGSMPHPGMDPSQALSPPQAALIATLAEAIVMHSLDWQMLLIGAGIAITFLIIDATILKRYNARLSLIAVGIGIYLPFSINVAIIFGSLLSYFIDKYCVKKMRQKSSQALTFDELKDTSERLQRRGVLVSSGLIVGESILGVLIAFLVIVSGNQSPLTLVPAAFGPIGLWLGFFGFFGLLLFCYYYITRKSISE